MGIMGAATKLSTLSALLGLLWPTAATAQEGDYQQGLFVGDEGTVGVGVSNPAAPLDVAQEPREGSHPEALSGLYVTGRFPAGRATEERLPGVQFRHSNGTQGIGFGYNTIYATGSNPKQDLILEPRGDGEVRVAGPLAVTGELKNDGLEARLEAIEDRLRRLVPVGTVVAWSGVLNDANTETLRSGGWIVADGRALDRGRYADLFTAIGTAHGAPDDAQFFIPDLRGRFVRGVDMNTGHDPDAADRIPSQTGGFTGDNVGSYQSDAFQKHRHSVNQLTGDTDGIAGGTYRGYPRRQSSEEGGSETRPKNVALYYLIKVSYDPYVP